MMTKININIIKRMNYKSLRPATLMRCAKLTPSICNTLNTNMLHFGLKQLTMTLLMVVITNATAWATDITVTYKIKVTGIIPHAYITDASTNTQVADWGNGVNTLWPAGASHTTDDDNKITFTPNQNLDKTNKNDNNETASCTAFKTTNAATTFTVATARDGYYIKSVTFKEDNTVKADTTGFAPNSTSVRVNVAQNKFFNSITVVLTNDYYYRLTPGTGLTLSTTPALTYNDKAYFLSGNAISMQPTNQNNVIEAVSGIGSSSATIAADKRSFSFAMPAANITPTATLAEIHTMSVSSGLTISSDPYITLDGTPYYKTGSSYTLTVSDANNIINGTPTVSGTGATYSVATDRKSMTITIGTADVTVSATLVAIAGTCGDNATWRMSDEDGDGTYETLNIEGTGATTNYAYLLQRRAPWKYNFGSTITTVNIANGITSIGQDAFYRLSNLTAITLPASVRSIGTQVFGDCTNLTTINIQNTDGIVSLGSYAFYNCNNLTTIVVPTPTLAVQYKTAGGWSSYASKLRVPLGNYLFTATDEGGTAAYEIATETDLRNLSSAVNATTNVSSGKTFRQTADITMTGGNFNPIGYEKHFQGTYDGGGYAISGLSVSNNQPYVGLFADVYTGVTVKNVNLDRPNITSSYSGSSVGALIGNATYCTIENCSVISPIVSATSNNNSNMVGVLVGHLTHSTIQNCFVVSPTISGAGSTKVGAICGYVYSNDTYHCTLTNVYYYNSNLEAIGYHANDFCTHVTNVARARKITAGENVTIAAPAATEGFTYDGDNYYREGLEMALGYSGNAPADYEILTYSANGTHIDGDTYTVNSTDGDATITADIAVPYLDADGNTQYCTDYTVLTSHNGVNRLDGGWYVVNGTVNYNDLFHCDSGDMHLVLCDGAKMSNYTSNYPISMGKGKLTIYAQSTGKNMGQLEAISYDNDGINNGTSTYGITICGGNITATGSNSNSGCCGIYSKGDITIHGGQLTATGNIGISSISGNIILGLRSTTDFIKASSYNASGTVSIADGQTLYDELGNAYSGTLTNNEISAIAGKTLRLVPYIAFADDTDNSTVISNYKDKSAIVTLSGRTLYKDGYWNTICLPFAVDLTDEDSPLYGATAKALSSASVTENAKGETLNLTFGSAVETLEAGVPYIIRWNEGENIVSPVFNGVTITAATAGYSTFTYGNYEVSFLGTYSPETLAANTTSNLFMGSNNKLHFPTQEGYKVNACRAYFTIANADANAKGITGFVIDFGDGDIEESATGITTTDYTDCTDSSAAGWFSIDGRPLSGKPTAKGIYIHGGMKVVIE